MTNKLIDKIIYTKSGKINPNAKTLILKNIELLNFLISQTKHLDINTSLSERIFNYVHKITEIKTCKECHNPLTFKYNTYKDFCSYKCIHKFELKTIDEASGKTLQQIRLENNKKSNSKIGNDGLTSYSRGAKKTWEKIKNSPNAIEKIHLMRRKTLETKIKNNSWNDERNRAQKSKIKNNLNRLQEKFKNDFILIDYNIPKWVCVRCGTIFIPKRFNYHPRCDSCFPHSRSKLESTISKWLADKNIKFDANRRKYLDNKYELDFYIPKYNLAIEANGDYFHSQKFCDKNYHKDKLLKCESKNIKLIQFFEHEIIKKPDICKSIIYSKLGINDEKLNARDGVVEIINSIEAKEFLNKNHIQGFTSATIYLGLKIQNRITSVMTFRKPRFNKKYDYEIIRFASLINVSVRGAASKLFSYFKKLNPISSVLTYSDLRFGSGDVYTKMGLIFKKTTPPNYFYIINGEIYSRYMCQKSNLKKILGHKFDKNLTESNNLSKIKAQTIYDCGSAVYVIDQF